jgi:hypothetical protein
MARVRILRRQNSGYLELPKGLLGYDELELFELKDGYYLLSVPLGGERAAGGAKAPEGAEGGIRSGARGAGAITPAERGVLRSLLAIRFEKRTPAYVAKELSEADLSVLRELERKGFVNVFRGQKYKEGVYNIRDSIYPLLSAAGQAQAAAVASPEAVPQHYSGVSNLLSTRGFIIINDKNEARSLSEQLASEMKSGAVVGVKGFDGKFYAVTRAYFTKAQAAIVPIMKEPMDADSIAAAAKLEPEGCRAVLRLMAENGDLIEKKRGIFAAI